ncbi:MAG: tetrahydromethanopterin S-methyltransferase subunit H [Methanotrichaceae archaeon]
MDLYRFAREQSIMNVAGVKIGGQPGENPTVLCGTMFYQGHQIVEDEDKGIFDRKRAEELINRQAVLSEETCNPAILHLYASTGDAFENYLDFVETAWDGPIILDSADTRTRSDMAKFVSEIGYADKSIYNSISLGMNESEGKAFADSDLDSAIVLAYNPTDSSVEGSLKVLEEGGAGRKVGLIEMARNLGMTNLLIDPGVVPLGDGAGRSLRFSVIAKSKFGLPVGSGIHNAVSSWSWIRTQNAISRKCCDSASAALQILSGGDFVLYGPIENAETVFPVAAMTDILVSEAVRELDVWPAADHPINRLI